MSCRKAMNSVIYKEQPQPRKEGADRNCLESTTGFASMIPHLVDQQTLKHKTGAKGPAHGSVRVWSLQGIARVVSGRVHSRQHSDNGLGRTSITKGHQGVIHRLPTILEGYVLSERSLACCLRHAATSC